MASNNKTYAAILLAAGKSSRFGENKLLVEIDGVSVIKRALQPYLNYPALEEIVVVTGKYHECLKNELSALDVKIVYNNEYEKDMAISIVQGLQFLISLDINISAIFIHPADIPLVDTSVIIDLINSFENGDYKILIPSYDGLSGHPVMIDMTMSNILLNVENEEKGLRSFINGFRGEVKYVNTMNEGILVDIDFPSDVEYINQIYKKNDNLKS